MKKSDFLDKFIEGDALETLKKLPSASVDLVVSSPPYNIGKEYEQKKALDLYLQEQKAILAECCRLLRETGSIFWQIGSYSNNGALIPLDVKFFPILEDLGMIPRGRIIWARQHGLHANKRFSGRHETILWFTKSDNYKFSLNNIRVPQKYQNKKAYRGKNVGNLSSNPLGKNPGDIWIFRNVKHNHEEQTIHPAQFPEDLITRIVLVSTDENDVVLDPYAGVGTVAVVARDFKRHYINIELDSKYSKVALRRISGEPDENNSFPNLKTLRQYIEKTGKPINGYRFDTQIGKVATDSSNSKIFSEEHHLDELYKRLTFEEDYFVAKVNGNETPDENGMIHKAKREINKEQERLF